MSSAAMLTTSGKLLFRPTNQALALPSAGYSPPFLQSQEATLGPKGLDRCTQVWIGGWELKVRYSPRLEMGLLCGGGGLAVNPLQHLMQP